jgi:hypothetical protein
MILALIADSDVAVSASHARVATGRCGSSLGALVLRNPITGMAGCCARACSGHAAAAAGPPSKMMNSRRRMPDTRAPPRSRSAAPSAYHRPGGRSLWQTLNCSEFRGPALTLAPNGGLLIRRLLQARPTRGRPQTQTWEAFKREPTPRSWRASRPEGISAKRPRSNGRSDVRQSRSSVCRHPLPCHRETARANVRAVTLYGWRKSGRFRVS